MKKDNNLTKWLFYFSIAVAVIIIYKILDNFTNITDWINNLFKILAPFVGGILIAYILYIPCKKVEEALQKTKKKRLINKYSRGLSVAIVYIMALLIIVIIVNCILPILTQSLRDLINNIPSYYEIATEKINSLPEDNILRSEEVSKVFSDIQKIDLKSYLNFERIAQYAKGVISAVSGIFNAFIAIAVSVYILCQRKDIIKFWGRFIGSILNKKAFNKVKKYFTNGNEIFFKFLTSQIVDAILVGILVSVAMSILKVKYAVLLGFMIGLFNLIPYFGAIVAVAIAIIVTLLTGGIGQTIAMAIVVIVLQQIDANIINPKIVGNSLQISQLVVIFAVTIGGAYFGVLGMFLAVPVVTIIKMIMEDYIEEKESRKLKTSIDNTGDVSL